MLVATYTVALVFTTALSIFIVATTVAPKPETVLFNKVTIYRLLDSLDVAKLAKIVNKYLKI
jgi:hypothetical protein